MSRYQNKISKSLFKSKIVAALALSGMLFTPAVFAEEKGLNTGKSNIDVRVRYESVSDAEDPEVTKDAAALTARVRFGYRTPVVNDFSAFAEVEATTALMGDYNNKGADGRYKSNAGGEYSVIADPQGDQMNRADLTYTGVEKTKIGIGRYRIKLDNDRFIGNVGWRQNEQTFDALLVVNKSLPDTTITFANITAVNSILGEHQEEKGAIVLNAGYSGFGFGKLTGYVYNLSTVTGTDLTDQTNNTTGLRFKGSTGSDLKILYTLESATQVANAGGAASGVTVDDRSASYLKAKVGVAMKGFALNVGLETLGSDEGKYGFSTPLATLHGQNGWADQFLKTPAGGLKDTAIALSGKVAGYKLKLVQHTYAYDQAADGYEDSTGLGSELNFVVAKKFAKKYAVLVKYASYKADSDNTADAKVDTTKTWLQVATKF